MKKNMLIQSQATQFKMSLQEIGILLLELLHYYLLLFLVLLREESSSFDVIEQPLKTSLNKSQI